MGSEDLKLIRDTLLKIVMDNPNVDKEVINPGVFEALDRVDYKFTKLRAQNSAFMMAVGRPISVNLHIGPQAIEVDYGNNINNEKGK